MSKNELKSVFNQIIMFRIGCHHSLIQNVTKIVNNNNPRAMKPSPKI